MLILPKSIKLIKKEGSQATFEIAGLYPGYGITLGNALRRVLLSSLEGAAVTQMKIKGVAHEFSTIPGVFEDVITIMLNLKQLRFKLFEAEPQTATLKIKGQKEVKGSDFVFPAQVELVNKSCHIASLTTKSAELEIDIKIEKGLGYSSRESRQKEKLEIGAIALDATFTPVKRVSYKVENMRVGERIDFDRLFLEVETDGVVSPEEAVLKSCEILIKHFAYFLESLEELAPKAATPKVKKTKQIKKTEVKAKASTKKSNEKRKTGKKTA